MENASKALIMAGEILIAVLILTFAVIIIESNRNKANVYHNSMSAQEIQKFNTQFLKYLEYDEAGNSYITAKNLVTIANLAEDITNEKTTPVTISKGGEQNTNLANQILSDNENMYVQDGDDIKIVYYKINDGDDGIKYTNGLISEINLGVTKFYKIGLNSFTNL